MQHSYDLLRYVYQVQNLSNSVPRHRVKRLFNVKECYHSFDSFPVAVLLYRQQIKYLLHT